MTGWTGHEEWMRDAEAIAAQSAPVSDQDRTIPERPTAQRWWEYNPAQTVVEDEDDGTEQRLRGMTW